MNEGLCGICETEIDGMFVTLGNGAKGHPHCYARQHKPRPATSLKQVARGHSDPVLAAEVICAHVSDDVAAKIIADYNTLLMAQWKRRCEP